MITENYFINNIAGAPSYGILVLMGANTNTIIECNHFINNQAVSACVIYFPGCHGGRINNNVFDGNTSDGNVAVVFVSILSSITHLYFTNNYIINNIASIGTCCSFQPAPNNNHLLHIDHNLFSNNAGANILKILTANLANSNLNLLYLKHNNFLDQSSQIELYNDIAYGSPNIYADSNYWGSTSTQHIDSIIYDYFDFANKSVVYYSPILTSPAVIDTSCIGDLPSGIVNEINNKGRSSLSPNPFTTTATIRFGKEVSGATFSLYNLLGEKVSETSGITAESFQLTRGSLQIGAYVYEVREKDKSICRGKAVVY